MGLRNESFHNETVHNESVYFLTNRSAADVLRENAYIMCFLNLKKEEKNLKKLLAVLLAAVMLLGLLSGCTTPASTTPADTKGAEAEAEAEAEPAGEEAEPAAEGDAEIPTIKIQMTCLTVPKDVAMVEEAVSAITREKIGVNVEFIMMEIANQTAQLNTLLAAGDDSIDIFFQSSLSTTVANGQALDITDYIEEYKDDIANALGQYVYDCGYVNDRFYGVPRLLDQASCTTFSIPADIAEEFGHKNGDYLSFEDLDNLFQQIHEKYPDTAIIGPNNGQCVIADSRVDQLGTSYNLGVLPEYGQAETVANYYESDEFLEIIGWVEKWSKAGYYMTDTLNVTDAPIDYITAGRCFGCFASHFSAELNGIWQSDNFGKEMACFSVFPSSYCKTPGSFFCVNPACKNPDKAVAMLWLLATDADIVNYMINGIEGVHYQVLEDGSATYADGVDATNVGWCIGYSWANLNSTLSRPFNYPADYFDILLKSNQDAVKSKAFGFVFVSDNVRDEIAACTNVYNQYFKTLFSDAIDDYDEAVRTLQDEMKAAGIDNIIAEKQTQLDAFLGK